MYGVTLQQLTVASVEDCAAACCQNPNCAGGAYVTDQVACYLKDEPTFSSSNNGPFANNPGIVLITITNNVHTYCATCQPPPPPPNYPCKRGLAYDFDDSRDIAAMEPALNWYYNWAPAPNSAVNPPPIEFVPMIWGTQDLSPAAGTVQQVIDRIPAGAKYLLGFNEPNFFAQSNLSPQQAAALWPQIQQIATAKNLKIVSPAVNYCGPANQCWTTDPFAYLQQFFGNCTGCQVDYVAAHIYSCDQTSLMVYLNNLAQFNKPIWITEFSCGDTPASSYGVQNTYMQIALQTLEANTNVFRYAWFSGRDTNVPYTSVLDTPVATLTEIGETYINYAQQCGSPSPTPTPTPTPLPPVSAPTPTPTPTPVPPVSAPTPTPTPTPTPEPAGCSYISQAGTTKTGDNYGNTLNAPTPDGCATLCCGDTSCVAVTFWNGNCYMKTMDQYNAEPTQSAGGVTLVTMTSRFPATVTWSQTVQQTSKRSEEAEQQAPSSAVIQAWIATQINASDISVTVNPFVGGFQVQTLISGSNTLGTASSLVNSLTDPVARASLEAATNSTVDVSSIKSQSTVSATSAPPTSTMTPVVEILIGCVIGIVVIALIVTIVVVFKKKEGDWYAKA